MTVDDRKKLLCYVAPTLTFSLTDCGLYMQQRGYFRILNIDNQSKCSTQGYIVLLLGGKKNNIKKQSVTIQKQMCSKIHQNLTRHMRKSVKLALPYSGQPPCGDTTLTLVNSI